jgi:protein-S-isoprenylcysteine O-methyltransferase Ste14
MLKFILFALILFSFSIAIHGVYGQLVPIQNNTEIEKENNQPTSTISQVYKKIKIEWWIFLLSILLIFIVTIISYWIIKRAQKSNSASNTDDLYQGGFWDIIREGGYHPSLARFQFLLWTFVISFSLLSVYFILLRNGIVNPDLGLPTNTLLLMGISTAVPIISNVISKEKYTETLSSIPKKDKLPKFSTMLLEGGKPTLGRYQMFLWIFLSIYIYLLQFNNYLNGQVINNIIPDVDDSLVFLMG